MKARSVLAILGGIAAAAALGVALAVALPGLLSPGGSIQEQPASASTADSGSFLGGERSGPAFFPVVMPISQDDFDEETTRIPVQVFGTTASGDHYDRLHFVDNVGAGIELVPGEYRMTIPAGYITGSGTVHSAPSDEVRVKIPVDQPAGEHVQATIYVPQELRQDNYVSSEIRERVEALTPRVIEMLVFPEVAITDVTEDMLDELVSFAKKDTADNGKAAKARAKVEKIQADLKKAEEQAKREAEKAEQQRLAEEQANAARAEGQAVLEAARRQAEEEAKKKEEEEKEKAAEAAASSALEGWWVSGSGTYYYFHNGAYEMFDTDGTTSLGIGSATLVRLTDDEAKKVGGSGFIVSVGGSQCYVMLDSALGVLDCRNASDLSKVASGSLSHTTEPEKPEPEEPSSEDAEADSSSSSAIPEADSSSSESVE